MALNVHPNLGIPEELLEAIHSFPLERKVEHCGVEFVAPAFDLYAVCPQCSARIKLRSFSAVPEIEDLFDAVFEWMNRPDAQVQAQRRMLVLAEEG